ncbi:hypothetical protein N7E81_09815 [Reichenbachiella carrageenanivorans]|uniref:Big-1 domain-containing protein n=1 Tax=Reichenbachiella carrageenanivorans TaxID=2979869 RepID=A0ABY6CUS6_9BACT|nr:hypothetical protein [Reichenbachiella carrageenanivorans]UXX77665.1 hypothetical protein N7E81_09815 [Reichenbachiella carrageenanivorans]
MLIKKQYLSLLTSVKRWFSSPFFTITFLSKVTGVSAGTCTITANDGSGTTGELTATITAGGGAVLVTSITVTEDRGGSSPAVFMAETLHCHFTGQCQREKCYLGIR